MQVGISAGRRRIPGGDEVCRCVWSGDGNAQFQRGDKCNKLGSIRFLCYGANHSVGHRATPHGVMCGSRWLAVLFAGLAARAAVMTGVVTLRIYRRCGVLRVRGSDLNRFFGGGR